MNGIGSPVARRRTSRSNVRRCSAGTSSRGSGSSPRTCQRRSSASMRSRPRCQWSIAGEAFRTLTASSRTVRAFNAGHPTQSDARYTRTMPGSTPTGAAKPAKPAKPRKPRAKKIDLDGGRRPSDRRPARRPAAGERRAHVGERPVDPRHGGAGTETARVGGREARRAGRAGGRRRATASCSSRRRASRWSWTDRSSCSCVSGTSRPSRHRRRRTHAPSAPRGSTCSGGPSSRGGPPQPSTNVSRTRRSSFSRFGSISTIDCHVPSSEPTRLRPGR